MSEDEEVLLFNNDLSRHIISEGYNEFETYYQPQVCSQFQFAKSSIEVPVGLGLNKLCCETKHHNLISSHDKFKLSSLLSSKLLLPEDFELVEFFISRTSTSNHRSEHKWMYSSGIIVATLSMALYFKKQISFQVPAALMSTLSVIGLYHCYDYLCRSFENRSFVSAIRSFQSLCLNVNKLFRMLKETEILSTGQVTSQNVGATLFIPIKSLHDKPQMLPTWKTLPHLRKSLASALIDAIDLIRSTCDEARKCVPDWLFIDGYTLSNDSFLPDHLTAENLNKTDYTISLKDLQLLNDSYLILQSEFFRWVGICICPSAWNPFGSSYNFSRSKILRLFFNAHSKLRGLSFKLKFYYSIENIFSDGELYNKNFKRTDSSEISSIQSELHNLYLLILSMLIHLRNLEDNLENYSIDSKAESSKINLCNIKDKLDEEIKNVRCELTSAMNVFNATSLHSFSNKHSSSSHLDKLDDVGLIDECKTTKYSQVFPEENFSHLDLNTNSLDEVFLAVSDIIPDKQGNQDDLHIEENPVIPNSLLAELSTTLKPIKDTFKEREKAALERAGLEDLNSGSDSDTDGIKHLDTSIVSSLRPTIRKRKLSKQRKHRYNNKSHDGNTDSDFKISTNELVNPHSNPESKSTQSSSTCQETSSASFSALGDRSIANMIAMKSQTWGLPEEECFSYE
ncbi:uncharacterized protein LOC129003667 [Macrosteles quadrilineatus]|uniref:uncharacterized protein LOC129003667 n=1 Tax=Macrosteles quadrilineatus TaxID=74068 RepID=UPI0023E0C248|nr:uncharacterized protein LOC129003667 [Macrosteles quadrilineatus]